MSHSLTHCPYSSDNRHEGVSIPAPIEESNQPNNLQDTKSVEMYVTYRLHAMMQKRHNQSVAQNAKHAEYRSDDMTHEEIYVTVEFPMFVGVITDQVELVGADIWIPLWWNIGAQVACVTTGEGA